MTRDSRLKPLVETPLRLDREAQRSDESGGSRSEIAQHSNDISPPTCSDCGKGLCKRNSTGRCQPCHRLHVAREARYCRSCRVALSRTAGKSGLCFDCFHQIGSASFSAEEGSRRLLKAIRLYQLKYQPETLRFGR